jgi:hypothetical protein
MNTLVNELGGTDYNSIVCFPHYWQACQFIDCCIKYNVQCEEVYIDINGLFYVHYLND